MNRHTARPARKLAVTLAASAALAAPLCACGSPGTASGGTHTGNQGRPAAAAGQAAGGTAQGVTAGVPGGWTIIDFSRDSITEAYAKLNLPAVSESRFKSTFSQLAGAHAVIAADTSHVKVLAGNGGDVLPSENAYCVSSGDRASGSLALGTLRRAMSGAVRAELGTVQDQKNITVAGMPAVETLFQPMSPAPGISEQAAGIAAEPRPGRSCYVYVTYPAAKIPQTILRTVTGGISYP